MLHSIDEHGNTSHICPHCQQKNEHHITHEHMEWMIDGDLVGLPPCQGAGCTTRTFVKTHFSEEDLQEPIIQRDEAGKIINVIIRGAPNLWRIVSHLEKDESGQTKGVIDTVVQHPAVAKHQELARQLLTAGRMPPTAPPEPEPETTEQKIAHIKALQQEITALLASLGLTESQ